MPKKKPSPAQPSADDPCGFEEALTELEEIVGEMEGDRVPLDELLKKYERGTKLLRLCQGQIAKAREKIEQISGEAENGAVGLEPFDPESGGSNKSARGVAQGSPAPEESNSDEEIQLL